MDRRAFLNTAALGAVVTAMPWLTTTSASATTQGVTVTSIAALQNAINAATPGTVITLANGDYTVPAGSQITVANKNGDEDFPITIVAQSRGGAILRGEKSFVFSNSSWITISGFSLRQSTTLDLPPSCANLRLTRNDLQFADIEGLHWVMVRADKTKVDRNHFHNKTTLGIFLGVEGDGEEGMAQDVQIFRNYFSDHSFPGDNGGEPIRLGISKRALTVANAKVEYNLFERANGDPEAISVKSSGNTIRNNTIRNSLGGIVLRHGNGTRVESNYILDGQEGIRIYGNDHVIVNNYLSGLTQPKSRALVVGSGSERDHVPGESETARRGNDAADRVLIAHNTLLNNTSTLSGETTRPFEPSYCKIVDNLFVGATGDLVAMGNTTGFTWSGNILYGAAGNGNIPAGTFTRANPLLAVGSDGVSRLSAGSPAINAATYSPAPVTTDIDGQPRGSARDVGADEYSTCGPCAHPLTTADVGPNAP